MNELQQIRDLLARAGFVRDTRPILECEQHNRPSGQWVSVSCVLGILRVTVHPADGGYPMQYVWHVGQGVFDYSPSWKRLRAELVGR